MASAQIFHLLTNPPVADYPDGVTIISASTPDRSRVTTMLLDPASPPIGAVQYLASVPFATINGSQHLIMGRWITRQLPPQTIGAGNWVFHAVARLSYSSSQQNFSQFGFCVAQWRAGTGVVARFLDAPNAGQSWSIPSGAPTWPTLATADWVSATVQAGGALTLLQNDQIILEAWALVTSNNNLSATLALPFYGTEIYGSPQGPSASPGFGTNLDAYLKAPSAIVYL